MTAKEILEDWVGNQWEEGEGILAFVKFLDEYYTINEKITIR